MWFFSHVFHILKALQQRQDDLRLALESRLSLAADGPAAMQDSDPEPSQLEDWAAPGAGTGEQESQAQRVAEIFVRHWTHIERNRFMAAAEEIDQRAAYALMDAMAHGKWLAKWR